MASDQFGSRPRSDRDAWLKKRENWRRNNPASASEVDDTEDDE